MWSGKWLWKLPNVNISHPHLYTCTHMHMNPIYISPTHIPTYTTADESNPTNISQRGSRKSYFSHLLNSSQGQSGKGIFWWIENCKLLLVIKSQVFPVSLETQFSKPLGKSLSVNKICSSRSWSGPGKTGFYFCFESYKRFFPLPHDKFFRLPFWSQ